MSDTQENVREAAREAAEEGVNLRERVRDITLKALSQRQLDRQGIREVIEQVTGGIVGGAGEQKDQLQSSLKQGLAGIDDALEKSAQAAKLAAQEAMGRTSDFSDHDLKAALQELSTLEDLFVDTLKSTARQSTDVAAEVLNNLSEHLKQAGTSAGGEARNAVESLQQQLKSAGRDAVLEAGEAGKNVGEQLAQIASGFLAGMADALQPKEKRD